MNFATRCSDVVLTARRAVASAGFGMWAGEVRADRAAVLVGVADGVDGVDGAERVAVDEEAVGMAELMRSVGVGPVDGPDVGAVDGRVPPALAAPAVPRAPEQPASANESAAAPARERAAYERTCLTRTHASEPINPMRSTFGMMAW